MIIEFTATLEDFTEARRAHQINLQKRAGAKWPFVIAVMAIVALPSVLTQYLGPRSAALINAIWSVCPFAILLAFMLNTLRNTERMGARTIRSYVQKRVPTPTVWRSFLNLVVFTFFFAVAVFFLNLLRISARTPAAPGAASTFDLTSDWLAPMAPWLCIFFVAFWALRRFNRGATERAWNQQPVLRRPHTAALIGDKAVISTSVSRVEYQWDAFVASGETPNLFLLYVSSIHFHMLPKRAFASPQEIEAFRNMLGHLIGTRESAFPVQTVQPPVISPAQSPSAS